MGVAALVIASGRVGAWCRDDASAAAYTCIIPRVSGTGTSFDTNTPAWHQLLTKLWRMRGGRGAGCSESPVRNDFVVTGPLLRCCFAVDVTTRGWF